MLFFQEQGSGEPVVLVHGLFGSSTNLRAIARKLAEQYRVFNVDLPNHGRSPHTLSMTYQDMGEALFEFSREVGVPKLNWVGHSMGGKAVMHLALTHSGCVDHLIVMDIAPVDYEHGHVEFIEALSAIDLNRIGSRADADQELAQTITDSATRLFLLQNLSLNEGHYTWRINLPVLREFHSDIMSFPEMSGAAFDGPTLLLSGAKSNYVSSADHPTILRYFPNTVFSVVRDAGHWVHADQPQAVCDSIVQFLSRGNSNN